MAIQRGAGGVAAREAFAEASQPAADLEAALGFVAEIGAADSVHAFGRSVVRGLRAIVPSALACYEETDPQRQVALSITDPVRPPDVDRADHVVSFRLVAVRRRPSAAVTLHRPEPFSEADHAVLTTLRPHLTAAYRNVWARQEAAALREGMVATGQEFVLAVPGGQILDASAGALPRLGRYFPEAEDLARLVADIIDPTRWPCRQGGEEQAEVVEQGLGRLALRVLPAAYPAPCMVLVDEDDTAAAVMPFTELGLTSREVEVATLVAGGSTNGEIATMLFVSHHTVKKHLEHIYAKLGVRTRTELAALVYQSGTGPSRERVPGRRIPDVTAT